VSVATSCARTTSAAASDGHRAQLLEQADALMRKNCGRGDADFPISHAVASAQAAAPYRC
jgi:hypothetical protein